MQAKRTWVFQIFTLLIMVWALAGCGGAANLDGGPATPTIPVPQEQPSLGLPSPEQLATRTLAFTEAGLMREGAQFETGLVNNLVTAAGTDLSFAPGPGVARGDRSFALYGFGVENYNRDLNIRLSWTTAPAVDGCYLILANFATNRWEWFPLPATNILNLQNIADYTGPGPAFNLYCAVMVTGSAANLDRIRVGTQPAPGVPNADLQASTLAGSPPLQVDFDATASAANAPATLVRYEFDLGTGLGFQDSATGLASTTYSTDGTYNAIVRVTDVFGAQDTASITIAVGNPALPTAALNAVPTSGNAPLNVDFSAAGSLADPPASLVKFEFDFDDGAGFHDMGTVSSAQHLYTVPGSYDAQVRVTDNFGGVDTQQVTITVNAGPAYDETEDNDSEATAQALTLPVNSFQASLGSGPTYPGLDGDDDDYFSFNAAVGDEIGITLNLDSATADIDVSLLDSDGDSLSGSFGTGDQELITYTIAAGDTAPFILYCYNLGGAGDYSDYSLFIAIGQPTANLSASPLFGSLPLDVDFDASASTDPAPGAIEWYEFDPEGDGTYLAPQASPLFSFQYTTQGNYTATVRVTDDEDNQSTASVTIAAGSIYDEVEDNDTEATASPLPALPFTGYRANLGPGGSYDGDSDDFFSVPTAAVGDTLAFRMTHDPVENHSFELYEADGDYITGSYNASSPEEFSHTVLASDTQPYVLYVYSNLGASDYELSGFLNAPLAALSATPNSGASPLNVVLDASASTDPGGSIDTYEFDPEGDGTFSAPQAGATFNFQYTVSGIYSATVKVTDNDANTALASVSVMVDITYDETEDNDDYLTPNPLPAFPFADYFGSHGTGTGYPGYDGDQDDFFSFNGNPGDLVSFTLTYDNTAGEMSIDIVDGTGTSVEYNDGFGGLVEIFDYELGSADAGGPYTLRVWDLFGTHYSDYELDGSIN